MLKKQTVWLLTMLSLMVVLSVYYMTSPNSEDLAYIDNGKDTEVTTGQAKNDAKSKMSEKDAEVSDIKNVGQDELFTTIRMEMQDERSKKKDRLNEVVASSNASAEEKNQALEDIDKIDKATAKETILQDSIIASAKQYEDVLVRSEEDKIHVHIKMKEKLSKDEAVKIMQLVRDEFGEVPVDINYQPTES